MLAARGYFVREWQPDAIPLERARLSCEKFAWSTFGPASLRR